MRHRAALVAIVMACSLLLIHGIALAGRATVTHWFSGPYAMYDFVMNQIPAFEAANPDLKIDLMFVNPSEVTDKYTVMFATDTPVDVIWTNNNNNLPLYMSRNLLLPLNNYAAKVGLDLGEYVEPAIKQATRDSQVFAVPYAALPTPGLFYNADLFDTAGVAYPTDMWSYEAEFLSAAKKLTKDTNGDGVPDQYGLGPQLNSSRTGSVTAVLAAYGGRILSLDGTKATATDEKTMAGFGFLSRLAHEDRVMAGSFWQGSAAMDLDGFWAIPGFTASLKGARTGAAATPLGPQGRKVMYVVGYYSVPRTATNPEGAMRWIKHLTSDEVGKAWLAAKLNMTGKMRVNASPEVRQDEMTRKWISFYSIEGLVPAIPANFRVTDVEKVFADAISTMASNALPLRQIAEQLQQKLTALLALPLQ
jgi:multiple sugar transport system substrate-binding protein